MARQYKSEMAQETYKNFAEMFKQEGNCYYTIKQSIDNDYEHGNIPEGATKLLLENILRDVTVDFFKDDVKVVPEDEYFK